MTPPDALTEQICCLWGQSEMRDSPILHLLWLSLTFLSIYSVPGIM